MAQTSHLMFKVEEIQVHPERNQRMECHFLNSTKDFAKLRWPQSRTEDLPHCCRRGSPRPKTENVRRRRPVFPSAAIGWLFGRGELWCGRRARSWTGAWPSKPPCPPAPPIAACASCKGKRKGSVRNCPLQPIGNIFARSQKKHQHCDFERRHVKMWPYITPDLWQS